MTREDVDYEFIKKWLRRGEIARLAKKHEIPTNSAYRILSGEWTNYEFVMAVYDLALERANKFIAYQQKVNDLKKVIQSYEH
jgi:hypothetical protein